MVCVQNMVLQRNHDSGGSTIVLFRKRKSCKVLPFLQKSNFTVLVHWWIIAWYCHCTHKLFLLNVFTV